MKVLKGSALGLTLRKLSDEARHRVCIVSPYVGRWPAVKRLLGGNWWLGSTLPLQIITDSSEASKVMKGTLCTLRQRGEIRSLKGVHAKIYVIDEYAIVTSANLTASGFSKRHEIGVLLDGAESGEVIETFGTWWLHLAKAIPDGTFVEWEEDNPGSQFAEEDEGQGLPVLWDLPPTPSDKLFNFAEGDKQFASYQQSLKQYKSLADQYAQVQRLWKDAPLFLELDSFLNYLYHEAEGRPSFGYHDTEEPRKLSASQRLQEIRIRASAFASWAGKAANERWREEYSKRIQKILAKDRIDELTLDDARRVVGCLNCMNSYRLNKYKFLNPANNSIGAIRSSWKALLYESGNERARMQKCAKGVRFFGTSSIQELMGWFSPERYPIRNTNSDSGLRFFGYRV